MPFNRREFLVLSAASLAATHLSADQKALPYGAPGVTVHARPRDYHGDLPAYVARLMHERRQERIKTVAAIRSRAQAEQRISYIRAKVWEMLGGPFEKTPLNARVAGSIRRVGYRIERVVYESRPRLYVTSNLYVPDGSGPFPAVLVSMGHAANGKAYASYQKLAHTLAKKGYVVLAFDPFGQGERIEYPGAAPGTSRLRGPTGEHWYAGNRLLLCGPNFAQYRTWDGIRGIDYLVSREEVDAKRIGCGGQSGGGTMTMYIAALDERVQAAVVSEGNTENVAQENFETPGAVDDAEQNLVPSLVHGIDRFDLLHAIAPRALLITVSNKDAGTTYAPGFVDDSVAALEELKLTYKLLGVQDRVKLAETPMRHGYTYEMRRASYDFFNRWLGNRGDDSETPVVIEEDKALWCTANGSVLALDGETSFSLTRRLLPPERPPQPASVEQIRRVLALDSVDGPPGAPDRRISTTEKYDHLIEEHEIASEREIRLPAWIVRPKGAAAEKLPAILVVSDNGHDSFIAEGQMAEDFARAGYVFAAAEMRGRGQCLPRPPLRGPRYYAGRGEDFHAWAHLMLGRPLLGRWVHDTLQAARHLRAQPQVDTSRLWLVGQGTMAIVALFALALDTGLRGGVVQNAIFSYRSIVEHDDYSTPFRAFLPGVLKHFDLPDVAARVTPRPLLLLNPVDQRGSRVLSQEDSAQRVTALYPNAALRSAEPVTATALLSWLSSA